MVSKSHSLLADIEAFLAATGMSESYFGKRAAGNSELVGRLRNNGRVWPETATKVRKFIRANFVRSSGHVATDSQVQAREWKKKAAIVDTSA